MLQFCTKKVFLTVEKIHFKLVYDLFVLLIKDAMVIKYQPYFQWRKQLNSQLVKRYTTQ